MITYLSTIIDKDISKELEDCLNSGWITTGKRVQEFQKLFSSFIGAENAMCVNSMFSATTLLLSWLNVKPGDEIIVPVTISAEIATSILNLNLVLKMVDIKDNYCIDTSKIFELIGPFTKAIFLMDYGIQDEEFSEFTERLDQSYGLINRPIIISDVTYLFEKDRHKKRRYTPNIELYSITSINNTTNIDGCIISINFYHLKENEVLLKELKKLALNGQTVDAYDKNVKGTWKYYIQSPGFKFNMPDIVVSVALAQMRKYEQQIFPERREIFNYYYDSFKNIEWVELPRFYKSTSVFNIFSIRIKYSTEVERDSFIMLLNKAGIEVNVNLRPLPIFSLFKEMGFRLEDYPISASLYLNEISLPIYPGLSNTDCQYIVENIKKCYSSIYSNNCLLK